MSALIKPPDAIHAFQSQLESDEVTVRGCRQFWSTSALNFELVAPCEAEDEPHIRSNLRG